MQGSGSAAPAQTSEALTTNTGPRLEISLGLERDRLRRLEAEADAQRARIEWLEGGLVGVHELHDLRMGARISGAPRRRGVFNVPQLVRFTRAELDTIQGIGTRALDTIELALLVHGYALQCEPEESYAQLREVNVRLLPGIDAACTRARSSRAAAP